MKGNEFPSRELNADAANWLKKLHRTLIVKEYSKGKGTVRNYCREMTLLFKYYNDKPVSKITQADIEQYLQYIKEGHQVGRTKHIRVFIFPKISWLLGRGPVVPSGKLNGVYLEKVFNPPGNSCRKKPENHLRG